MTSLGGNPLGAMKDFQRNYQDMLDAGWKGGDSCRQVCRPVRPRGLPGEY
jgi:hypothetical protein